MAAAHSGAWAPLAARLMSRSPQQSLPQLDCCAPLLPESASAQKI
jgi:hypothetical protein